MTPDDPLASLYHDRIRTLAAAVRNDRRLEGADLSLTQVSPLCGSRVTLDIALDAALRIKAFGWRVRACTLGAAAICRTAAWCRWSPMNWLPSAPRPRP